ncbi:hypothetical protein QYE76_004213 [Lolium multiflorum]|uniref:DUF6598 domain-containing protein n=1 Tax=Lolium multiflorum TaxID=4521 RepID=A0AAD8W208_LOLMU|nr:hypothetical protein QYE76_004213 [Lolium multiflorum]
MESGIARAVASPKAPHSRVTLADETSIEEKRRKIESGGAQAVSSSAAAPRSRVPLGDDGRPLDGVTRAKLLRHLRHGDGSIYIRNGYYAKVYRLHDTNETCLEPMMMTEPSTSCMPDDRMVCQTHEFRTMMQIFYLRLANTCSHVGSPVELYGYVAVRDLLNPMRNYIFNRPRDDPFVVGHDGFIQMNGPKRGIRMEAHVLIEFDMKIKKGGEVEDDLQLIDCVASFSHRTSRNATANRRRIDCNCGAVDITYALLDSAAEATVQVGISELALRDNGLRLKAAAFYTSQLSGQFDLFDGMVTAEASELSRIVVAVVKGGHLLVSLILSETGGSDRRIVQNSCTFPVQKHGNRVSVLKLGLATIEVKVTWSTLDIPQSLLLGPNCFKWEYMAAEGIEYDGD